MTEGGQDSRWVVKGEGGREARGESDALASDCCPLLVP